MELYGIVDWLPIHPVVHKKSKQEPVDLKPSIAKWLEVVANLWAISWLDLEQLYHSQIELLKIKMCSHDVHRILFANSSIIYS